MTMSVTCYLHLHDAPKPKAQHDGNEDQWSITVEQGVAVGLCPAAELRAWLIDALDSLNEAADVVASGGDMVHRAMYGEGL